MPYSPPNPVIQNYTAMLRGNESVRPAVTTPFVVLADPRKRELAILLAGGIVTWLCIEVWLGLLVGDFHHEADPHLINLGNLSIGICFALMSVTIVYILKLKHAAYFAGFVATSTALLFFAPSITYLLQNADWVVGTKNTISILVRSFALIAVAFIFANKIPTQFADQFRLRMPERTVASFALPLIAWLAFNSALSQIFVASGVDVHSQDRVFERFAALGSNPILALAVLSIVVPLGEEILFRGFMVPIIRKISNVTVAVIFSASLFGLIHIDPSFNTLHSNVYIFGMGILLATTCVTTRSIWPAVLLHSVNNTYAIYEIALA